jgi:hypothetical protein
VLCLAPGFIGVVRREEDGRAYHIHLCNLESLDILQPRLEVETPHNVRYDAATKRAGVGAWNLRDVEHGVAYQASDL